MKRLKTLIRFSFASLLLLFLLSASLLSHQAATSAAQIDEEPHTGEDDPILTAIVVVKAASGASYMDDRDYIATMPELKTVSEMQSHIVKYEPDQVDMQRARIYLERQGFKIITHDNLFLVISGLLSDFEKIIPNIKTHVIETSFDREVPHIIQSEDFINQAIEKLGMLDGMLLYPLESISNPGSTKGKCTQHSLDNLLSEKLVQRYVENSCPSETKTVSEIARLMQVDKVHARDLKGKNVRIGFIDSGVYAMHPYFHNGGLDIQSFRFVDGEITIVGNNFIDGKTNGHGTMVASYLGTFAPNAKLLSFAMPISPMQQNAPENINSVILEYLVYINQNKFTNGRLVDVLNLSQGVPEEAPADDEYRPAIRHQMINFMVNGGIVLAASGNANQDVDGYDSGHNGLASIPEVIAVGGADFEESPNTSFRAAGKYNDPCYESTGSASFISEDYSGRCVPDVVGIYGPDICYPRPSYRYLGSVGCLVKKEINLDAYYRYASQTSGAAPQIAGIVALLKQRDPSLKQTQVRSILENAAWDIQSGESGDGDPAARGYDLATGYGLPLADRVMTERFPLYSGWNLIGLTKDRGDNYTADDFMQEIREQNDGEWTCDTVTRRIRGRYESRIIKVVDGKVKKFGFNFELQPEAAYFVRCDGTWWEKAGVPDHINTPQTITFEQGWNFFSIPYSEAPCTVEDLFDEMSEGGEPLCDRVLLYDGQLQEALPSDNATLGKNFSFVSGRGYIARCYGIQAGESHGWTPDCQDENSSTADYRTSFNTYAPNPKASTRLNSAVSQATSISAKDENSGPLEVDLISKMVQHSRSDEGTLTSPGSMYRLPSTGTPAHEILEPSGGGSPCKPQEVYLSNLTGRTFSISWVTDVPCMGSLYIMDDDEPVFQAFDDRGIRFSGTTHHVTVRGLDPETTYSFGLLSGDVWDHPYEVQTGALLDMPTSNFSVYGQVGDTKTSSVKDTVVYAQLEAGTETSTILSFPLGRAIGRNTEGYALTLDNARTNDVAAYFDYTAADKLYLLAEGGSAGVSADDQSIDLSATTNINAPMLTFDETVPRRAVPFAPHDEHIISLKPTFRFSAMDSSGNSLTYRLELSTDNFATVARVYDQRHSLEGWSASSYASGDEVRFTIPDELKNLHPYQWRAFTYNGEAWSTYSDITTFSVGRYFNLYLPVVLSNN
jgi:hypothetical protein